ncbi:DUF1289 domain-containing protein [Microvirga sp. HBU67558]|uniref:DUF1289 domain-containing protein n=1 Tax=Microvirga TaxID=186650 RepID=UPI001B37A245|nr:MULTISPECIES: DUF1289 domain-containing protein [unclassified Microvirga]MBQ0821912.1 DUF1289 domain-containing protein [Microvirga sp. HBU67558]
MKKDNPCISECEFDGCTGWCLGCGRTIPEIREWRKLTPYRRTALLRELPRRVKQVRTDNEASTDRVARQVRRTFRVLSGSGQPN